MYLNIIIINIVKYTIPGGSDDKISVCNPGDLNSIPGLARSLRKWNGYPLQSSFLEDFMDRRASGLQSMGSQRVRYI